MNNADKNIEQIAMQVLPIDVIVDHLAEFVGKRCADLAAVKNEDIRIVLCVMLLKFNQLTLAQLLSSIDEDEDFDKEVGEILADYKKDVLGKMLPNDAVKLAKSLRREVVTGKAEVYYGGS